MLRPHRGPLRHWGEWEKALAAIVVAGVLDGFDGRIARLLRAQSKFGAELDSLSDNIAFGTAPALIIFLWSLQDAPRFGWIAALALAVCCALRLARFNARIDADSSRTSRPASTPAFPRRSGRAWRSCPIYLWLISGETLFQRLAAGDAMDLVHRGADDLERADLHLELDPHPPRLADVRAWPAWRCSARHCSTSRG